MEQLKKNYQEQIEHKQNDIPPTLVSPAEQAKLVEVGVEPSVHIKLFDRKTHSTLSSAHCIRSERLRESGSSNLFLRSLRFNLLYLFLLFFFQNNCSIDFETSMKADAYKHIVHREHDARLFIFLHNLYNKNNSENSESQQQLKIPKIIHQIWLGSKLPAEYAAYRASWIEKHPDWLFVFWTDNTQNYDQGILLESFEDLEEYSASSLYKNKFIVIDTHNVSFDNKIFFDAAINYGERSDILKWEVVYRFGGLYVDADFECLKPFDALHYRYDFYTGIQPLDTNMVQLGAALYAACPKHPVMQACVENIKNNQKINQIVVKTGPIHFTRMFYFFADKVTQDIAFPASFFYPCSYEQRGLPENMWRCEESYAVHHWAGSWLKPEGFVKH